MLHIREITPSRTALRPFVMLPLALYRDDERYILPSINQQVDGLLGRHNALISNGVQIFLMAYDGERPVGRMLAGIDFRAAQMGGEKRGYLSMFECVEDQQVANALLSAGESFLRLNGIGAVIGPTPTLFDDFGAGLLVEGFDAMPTFLSPYNPPYYEALFEGAGYAKHRDLLSYDMKPDDMHFERYESVLHRAGKRFGYAVESVNLQRDLSEHAKEFSRIIAESTPPEWDALTPTSETLYREFRRIRRLLWPDYAYVARAGQRPVGVLLVIPDVNPLLKGLRGHMFPVGTFRTVFARGRVNRVRSVLLYVIPEYQNKGVELVMIHRAMRAAREHGVTSAEASMINEQNLKLRLGVEQLGGRVGRVYRQFRKEI